MAIRPRFIFVFFFIAQARINLNPETGLKEIACSER